MSLASHRRKLDRMDEDDEVHQRATLLDLILRADEIQEQKKRAAGILVVFACALAGTSPAAPTEATVRY